MCEGNEVHHDWPVSEVLQLSEMDCCEHEGQCYSMIHLHMSATLTQERKLCFDHRTSMLCCVHDAPTTLCRFCSLMNPGGLYYF